MFMLNGVFMNVICEYVFVTKNIWMLSSYVNMIICEPKHLYAHLHKKIAAKY